MLPWIQGKVHAKEATTAVPTALQEYVHAPDDSFSWKIRSREHHDGCEVLDILLTSQTWQGITWKHTLSAFVPDNAGDNQTVLLFITGGAIGDRPGEGDLATGIQLATLSQTPCAFLHRNPTSPCWAIGWRTT
jgi:PhoPQ-activated pathogenicity-related protein